MIFYTTSERFKNCFAVKENKPQPLSFYFGVSGLAVRFSEIVDWSRIILLLQIAHVEFEAVSPDTFSVIYLLEFVYFLFLSVVNL
jgi:hypothetical protein